MEQARQQSRQNKSVPRLLMAALLTVALTFGVAAATALAPVTVGQAHAASISKKSVTLTKGSTYQLKLKKAKAKKVKWSSSKKSVVSVGKAGKLKAKKAGKATITAKYKGKKYKCKVTVENAAAGRVAKVMKAVESSPDSIEPSKGITALLYGDDDYAVVIASDRNSKCVKFALVVDGDGSEVSATMTVSEKAGAPAEITVKTTKGGKLSATAKANKATYRSGTSLSWHVKENKKLGYSNKVASKKCSEVLGVCVDAWDEVLKLETGYSLNYLGFSKL